MNRRLLLKAIAGVVPAGAAVRMEAEAGPRDLLIVEYPLCLSMQSKAHIRDNAERLLGDGGPRVLICDGGAKVRVERGVIRVEHS
jgi:hypothetical protein